MKLFVFVAVSGAVIGACNNEECSSPEAASARSTISQGLVAYGLAEGDDSELLPLDTDCAFTGGELHLSAAPDAASMDVAAAQMFRSAEKQIVLLTSDGAEETSLASNDYVLCEVVEGESNVGFACATFSLGVDDVVVAELFKTSGGERHLTLYRGSEVLARGETFDLLPFINSCLDVFEAERECTGAAALFSAEYCTSQAGNFDDCNFGENIALNDAYFRCVLENSSCDAESGTFNVADECVWTGC